MAAGDDADHAGGDHPPHRASRTTTRPADSAGIVRAIYAYHARTQGWGDIGYNALVDKYGTIFEGRAGGLDRHVVAAHAGGFNRETFGIAMMGNLETTLPTPAAVLLRRRARRRGSSAACTATRRSRSR